MRFPMPKKRRYWIASAVVVPLLVVLVLISGIIPHSRLNCWREDVDIHSGRTRYTRYLLYCQVGQRVEDTWVSHAVAAGNVVPEWRCVNLASPGSHSPHYVYHGAIHQIKTLEYADNLIPFEPAARQKVANTLLELWRSKGEDSAARDYVNKVEDTVCALLDSGASTVNASEIPDRNK